jgi:hypothetical protein
MIAREPLKRDPNAGRKPERAVLRNLGAGCSRLPAIAILPPALERRIVGLRELVSGESRLKNAWSLTKQRNAEGEGGSGAPNSWRLQRTEGGATTDRTKQPSASRHASARLPD